MFEQMLGFNCDHVFYDVGPAQKRWTSTNTNSEPPKSAPLYQEQKCLNCGGVREICKPEQQ